MMWFFTVRNVKSDYNCLWKSGIPTKKRHFAYISLLWTTRHKSEKPQRETQGCKNMKIKVNNGYFFVW